MEKIMTTKALIETLRYNIAVRKEEHKPTVILEGWLADALRCHLELCQEALAGLDGNPN